MAQEYAEYLAVNVLNEQQIVSYRSLSRVLKVHSNLAKQMLFEFHRKQNAKKPGSVHATYLITGTEKPQHDAHTNGVQSQDTQDTIMQSSPPLPGSSAPESQDPVPAEMPVTLVLIAKEEDLEMAKLRFETITGIHIYSLEHTTLSNINSLAECNRKVALSNRSEDPLEGWKHYGTIRNLNVKRRTRSARPQPPAPIPTTAAAKSKPLPPTTKPTVLEKQASEASAKSKESPKEQSAKPTPEPEKDKPSSRKSSVGKPGPMKREASDIFKSFAKSKTKPKKEATESSAEASPVAEPEDEPMQGMSADEADDAGLEDDDEVKAPSGKSKKQREEELQAMMDQDDEPMEDAPAGDTDRPEEQAAPIDKPEAQSKSEPAETVTVSDGRRRGRRRIMKKKTVKDEEGYLVTKEEAAWESFSEEEPAQKKIKTPSAAASLGPKSKKVSKPGQGNIMSFFGKK